MSLPVSSFLIELSSSIVATLIVKTKFLFRRRLRCEIDSYSFFFLKLIVLPSIFRIKTTKIDNTFSNLFLVVILYVIALILVIIPCTLFFLFVEFIFCWVFPIIALTQVILINFFKKTPYLFL